MKLYRYYSYDATTYSVDEWDNVHINAPNYKLQLEEFEVSRETPKCYVIGENTDIHGFENFSGRRYIRKAGKKRFAYPTKEEALHGYIKRTEAYLKILGKKVDFASECLRQAKEYESLQVLLPPKEREKDSPNTTI